MQMMEGNLKKMRVSLGRPVLYSLQLGEAEFAMNAMLGHRLSIWFDGRINCSVCGRKTSKAFGEGLCYPCFMNAPENSPCIVRPELCEGHLGKGRDVEWEQRQHVQPHAVYLAFSGGLKVGVTRMDQIPTRWIDQGASEAIVLAQTPYRQLAGQIEVALKAHVGDKTAWQKMLKNLPGEGMDLIAEKKRLCDLLEDDNRQYCTESQDITQVEYPVLQYPESVKSLSLDKTPEITGRMTGIRGQYLIFDDGRVMNVRSHTGYWVRIEME